jgi:3-oxoacid CoA-transferase
MDLSCGAKRVIVTMTHTNKSGESKILPQCLLPLTAQGVVDVVVTELAVFHFTDAGLTLRKIMPGSSLEEITARTAAAFVVDLA